MRKVFTFLFLFVVLLANARQITADEAAVIAQEFLNSKAHARGTAQAGNSMELTLVESQTVCPYYAFNRDGNGGFVIVSADEQSNMVLGYSDKGSFDFSNIPPQLKALLKTGAANHKAQAQTRAAAGQVLYETAEWGQNAPFNAMCPTVDGVTPPAGCVATAMAIVMKYHNWPDYTRGGMQANYYYPEQRFDFSNYTIDWDALNEPGTDRFNQEVAKLAYSAGVAAGMIYGVAESAAEVWPISHKMMEYYTYAPECQFIDRSAFDDEKWNSILMEQLNEVGPVVYSGNGTVGHCFVIDGYDEKGYYHVNWGWDGFLNGYYALDFSDVGGMSFSDYQGMIINIKPDHERRVFSKSWMPNVDVYIGKNIWNFTSSDITPGEKISLIQPYIVLNDHIGYYKFAVVDEKDHILEIIGSGTTHHNNSLEHYCQYPGMQLEFYDMVLPELKEGQRYQLVSMDAELDTDGIGLVPACSDNPADWKIVLGGIVHPSYFYDKGNNSDIVSVNFHVDEKLPAIFEGHDFPNEFSVDVLRGGDCAYNLMGPPSGISFEVTCTDKEGNPKEPVYVGNQTKYGFSFNISAYEDKYDVGIKYIIPENSRNDADISPDLIIEHEGLIYKIEDNGCSLIGYDKNISESITIPENVSSGDKTYNVTSIYYGALASAPVKEIAINAPHLELICNSAFGGIENLTSVSIDNISGLKDVYWYPFLKSNMKNVYSKEYLGYNELSMLVGVISYGWEKQSIERDDLDFYLSELPEDGDYRCNDAMYWLDALSNDFGKAYNSFNIPGLGNTGFATEINNLNAPITQMWSYEIDKESNCVKLGSVIDNVVIDKVEINGIEAEKNETELYAISNMTGEGVDVVVNYTINSNKQMTTHYTPAYNAGVESSTLIETGIENVNTCFDNKRFNVYNMQGICIMTAASQSDMKRIKPGIYVIDNKKICIK